MFRIKTFALIQVLLLAFVATGNTVPSAFASGDDTDELHGTIEALPGSGFIGDWTVSGTTVHVTSSTRIKQEHGQVAIGARVEVKGGRQSNGSMDASTIEVESGTGGGDDNGGGGDDDNGSDDEIHGMIASLPSGGLIGDWVVGSRTVHVSASTSIETEHGQVAIGASVEVHGVPQSDGSLDATRIEVNPSNGGGSSSGEAKFYGTVDSLPSGDLVGMWMVSGRAVRVEASTVIEREHGVAPGVGSYVEVEGNQQQDGSIAARKVEVKTGTGGSGSSSTGYIEIRGSVATLPASGFAGEWIVGSQRVNVTASTVIEQRGITIQRGTLVEVRGNGRADGSIDAAHIETKASSGSSRYSKFYGTIESMPTSGLQGAWVIAGRTVTVSASTRLQQELGRFAVGAYVEVKGKQQADGSIAAVKIEVKSGAGSTGGTGYIEFKGTIEQLPQGGFTGDWTVSGRTVHVPSGVRLRQRDGQVRIGARVEVEGNLRTDGSVDASKIDVKN